MRRRIDTLLRTDVVAWAVLAVLLFTTLLGWRVSSDSVDRRAEDRFRFEVEDAKQRIAGRIADHERLLRSGVALFNTGAPVSRQVWKTFVESLRIDAAHRGIEGIGYAQMLRPDEKAAHEAAIGAEGFAGYRIRPDGERDAYSAIVYLEPFDDRNRRALGYDMYAEPVRRAAMIRATESGQPSVSHRVSLVQDVGEDAQPGFLMFLPVYRAGQPLDTMADRHAALQGFVYSPFRAKDLLRDLFASGNADLIFRVFDGGLAAAESLVYDSRTGAASAAVIGHKPRHRLQTAIELPGHRWTLQFDSSPEFDAITSSDQPTVVASLAGLADFLLFGVILSWSRQSRRLADKNAELEVSRNALRDTTLQFQTLVANIPDTIFRSGVDHPWPVQHIGPSILRLTGVDAASMIERAMPLAGLIHPDDLEQVRRAVADAVRERRPYEAEFRVRHADGSMRWAAQRGRAAYGADGEARWLDGLIIDITALKRLERRFYETVEAAPFAMVMVDAKGCIALVNAETERLFGYRAIDLLGRPVEVLVPERFRHAHGRLRDHFFGAPKSSHMGDGRYLSALRKDGVEFPVEISLNPIDIDGATYVLSAIVDISERKRAEEALKFREARFRAVIETSQDGFWVTDVEAGLQEVNDAYCRMSGYSRDELLGMRVTDLEAREAPEETAAHLAHVIEQGYDRFETLHRRKDGSVWPVEITVSHWPEAGSLFVFCRDITEIKALEAERRQAEEKIRHLAYYDNLTELPNRRLLLDRLRIAMAAAGRRGLHGALLFIDLDNFKTLNDTLGHDHGDRLLVEVARRLEACVRKQDTVSRLGGDEFVVMIDDLAGTAEQAIAQAERVAEKIRIVLNRSYYLGEQVFKSSPSIGITLFHHRDESTDTVLRRADQAMYQAKAAGRNSVCFLGA